MTTTLIHPQVWRSADGSVGRLVTIKPGMCGHNSLFYGQLGDWTWETVSELCDTDAFNAYNAAGQPTYLSFYYFHVRAGDALHPRSLSFGHRVEVVSRVFGFGSESVLTLHRLRQVGPTTSATRTRASNRTSSTTPRARRLPVRAELQPLGLPRPRRQQRGPGRRRPGRVPPRAPAATSGAVLSAPGLQPGPAAADLPRPRAARLA